MQFDSLAHILTSYFALQRTLFFFLPPLLTGAVLLFARNADNFIHFFFVYTHIFTEN